MPFSTPTTFLFATVSQMYKQRTSIVTVLERPLGPPPPPPPFDIRRRNGSSFLIMSLLNHFCSLILVFCNNFPDLVLLFFFSDHSVEVIFLIMVLLLSFLILLLLLCFRIIVLLLSFLIMVLLLSFLIMVLLLSSLIKRNDHAIVAFFSDHGGLCFPF